MHVFEIEWKYRQKQVENHIALLLDKCMNNCMINAVSHENCNFGQKFFNENAVAFRNISENCLALHSNGEVVFVAEYEMQDSNTLALKQFCFKLGHYVENVFDKISMYAKKHGHCCT